MFLHAMPQPTVVDIDGGVRFEQPADPWSSLDRSLAVRTERFQEFEIGDARYRLRRPVSGEFFPGKPLHPADGQFVVPGFGSPLIGRGSSREAAFSDWKNRVHMQFQQCYGKRAFELTDSEADHWNQLRELIDVERYASSTPVALREIGRIADMRPAHQRIQWISGFSESITLDQAPPEFAAYLPGMWFESVVERDPVTMSLIRLQHCQRLPDLAATDEAVEWDSTKTLPEAAWA